MSTKRSRGNAAKSAGNSERMWNTLPWHSVDVTKENLGDYEMMITNKCCCHFSAFEWSRKINSTSHEQVVGRTVPHFLKYYHVFVSTVTFKPGIDVTNQHNYFQFCQEWMSPTDIIISSFASYRCRQPNNDFQFSNRTEQFLSWNF